MAEMSTNKTSAVEKTNSEMKSMGYMPKEKKSMTGMKKPKMSKPHVRKVGR
jgi:hypothetical protein